MQIFAIVVSLAITAVAVALFARTVAHMVRVIRLGQPAHRTDEPGRRFVTLVKETLGHTRMLQWTWTGIGHWFIFVGFGLLFFTLVNAYGQLFDAHFILPVIGHFPPFEWITEAFTWVMLVAIVAFIGYRVSRPKERVRGEKGRFYGSTFWQGYFVETVILLVGLAIITLRALEYAIAEERYQSLLHFPLTAWMGQAFTGLSTATLENLIWLVAMIKIVVSMVWMITLALTPTMGVAWHRFSVFFNIFFKREADGGTALGGLPPMTSGGKVIDFEDLEEMDEDTALGVGKVEGFSWKGLLDFTTCTECGRCQSQCPAWNTDKPLSPKLLITNLRDHAYAKAPYLLADESEREKLDGAVLTEAERPLVGETEGWAWMPEGGAVIDSDVLWSCTSCGACVQQCPVDIEHVDHIMDMRRHQVLVESNFPAELNGLFKGLENKGNPWNMSPNARLEWAQGLDFEVKVAGEDIESLDEVDWLFWVGCAGAYEDRAKKTTRAVAELLNMAGISFAVLGNGETCTGDPARRAGNEFVFQGLATQNAETFKEMKVKKAVTTCAHCFNTLKNEYAQFGVELEVVHHTQLLNRLVREGKLTPVPTNGAPKRSLTYHDPCYLGRHNQVYSPPRELLTVIPDAELKEMPRNSERSFCCGAGGARMWMEEKIGERINLNRTAEAVDTGADQIATGCPFCRVMLSDGLTAKQADGSAREEVEVLDVAQLLLASVKGESRTPVAAGATAKAGAGAAAGAASAAVKAEPSAGDVTQTASTVTDTEDVGANAAATEEKSPEAETSKPISSGSLFDAAPEAGDAEVKPSGTSGTSLFDADTKPAAGGTADAGPKPGEQGGSLFDVGTSEPEAEAEPEPSEAKPSEAKPSEPKAAESSEPSLGTGGSLFDVGTSEPEPKAEPAPAAEKPAPPASEPKAAESPEPSLGTGGSLFDIAPSEPETKPAAEAPKTEPAATTPEPKDQPPAEEPATEASQAEPSTAPPAAEPAGESTIESAGSLFDIAPSEPETKPAAEAPTEEPKAEVPAAEASSAERTEEPGEDAAATAEPKAEEPATEDEPATPPASSGEKHEPKKGGIEEGKSLFDI